MAASQPFESKAKPVRFAAVPKRGAAGQWGRWRIAVTEGEAGRRLDTRTLRAGEVIAALLNGERVPAVPDEAPRPRFEALPQQARQSAGWLVVRLEGHGSATEIARTGDEALALRVVSLLTTEAPLLDPPPRWSIMRLGQRRQSPS